METKTMLLQYCIDYYAERANQAQNAINAAQESANDETKSSAGDKYETSRAMGHLARDMYAKNMDISMKTLRFLSSIKLKLSTKVELGSLVKTTENMFFIASSIGIVPINNQTFIFVSLASPVGKNLENKMKGDFFMHLGKKIEILEVL